MEFYILTKKTDDIMCFFHYGRKTFSDPPNKKFYIYLWSQLLIERETSVIVYSFAQEERGCEVYILQNKRRIFELQMLTDTLLNIRQNTSYDNSFLIILHDYDNNNVFMQYVLKADKGIELKELISNTAPILHNVTYTEYGLFSKL